jgi:hypothetical protein
VMLLNVTGAVVLATFFTVFECLMGPVCISTAELRAAIILGAVAIFA